MTKQLLQRCLDALQNHSGNYKLNREECKKQEALEDAIKQALAQPCQLCNEAHTPISSPPCFGCTTDNWEPKP